MKYVKYIKKISRDKYNLMGMKKGENRYFSIEFYKPLKCLCSYHKKTKGIIFHVNKVIDVNSKKEVVKVNMDKKLNGKA